MGETKEMCTCMPAFVGKYVLCVCVAWGKEAILEEEWVTGVGDSFSLRSILQWVRREGCTCWILACSGEMTQSWSGRASASATQKYAGREPTCIQKVKGVCRNLRASMLFSLFL